MEEIKFQTKKGTYIITKNGDISDSYHTFDELYDYRMVYNAAFFKEVAKKYKVEKSLRHSSGEMCFGGGWFIVVAELPTGQVSNHYENKYMWLFDFCEAVEKPTIEYDNHTPEEAKERIVNYIMNY